MLKSKTQTYDECRNVVPCGLSHTQDAVKFLSGRPFYVEKCLPFFKEIMIMVALTAGG